jgi:uncharacterized protein (TIGR02246 family)
MRVQRFCFLALPVLLAGLAVGRGLAQPARGTSQDKAAIASNAEAFIEAFQKGDAKAVAAFWAADGDYTNPSGRHLKGREAIAKAFQAFFAENKGLKVRIESDSLRFVTPEVAIEDGTNFVFQPRGGPPSRARYVIVHVKKDGKWLLSSVRETPFVPPSNHEHLRGLEWAIGNWSTESDQGETETLAVSWTDNQNFVIATFEATVKDASVGRATHWIGWDPQTKRIRSWIFDESGGFGEGSWTRDGGKWVIKTKSVLQDGKNATATFLLGRVNANTLTLQSRDRTVDGKALPDTREFKLKRVK